MTTIRKLMLVSAVALVGTGSALAQEGMRALESGEYMWMDGRGQVHRMKAGKKSHDHMMTNAREVAAGTVFYRSGDKLYMVENTKLPSGRMLIDEFRADPPQ
jgi:hypothetical protein